MLMENDCSNNKSQKENDLGEEWRQLCQGTKHTDIIASSFVSFSGDLSLFPSKMRKKLHWAVMSDIDEAFKASLLGFNGVIADRRCS